MLTPDQAVKIAERLCETWDAEKSKLDLLENYYKGIHRKPSFSAQAELAYGALWESSTVNYMQLVVHTVTQRLAVDGYRASKDDAVNAAPWRLWQLNGLDARQKPFYLEVGKYGYGYVAVVPVDAADGKTVRIRPLSPMSVFCEYVDPDDDWPVFAIQRHGNVAVLWDPDYTYQITYPGADQYDKKPQVTDVVEHGIGVVPFVRFDNTMNLSCGCPQGEIEPLLQLQDQINRVTFIINLIGEKASFEIKWLTGVELPTDDDGNPINPFRSAPDEVWTFPDVNVKAGAFAASNPAPFTEWRQRLLQDLFSQAQIPPHYGSPDLANISADALAALEAALDAKVNDRQTLMGESWERVLRLASAIVGDTDNAGDESAQVWWRDAAPKSLAATVQAAGQAVQMLGVPQEAAWLWLPGVTRQDVEDWKSMQQRNAGSQALQQIVQRFQNGQGLNNGEPGGGTAG